MWRSLLPSWSDLQPEPTQRPEAITPVVAGTGYVGQTRAWNVYKSADGLHVLADRLDEHQAAELALALLERTNRRRRLAAVAQLIGGLR